jgi:23S rRNA (guanosine2251-2'-O)-methyltransferase
MSIDTLFLDAGGVLVFPNWARVSEVLARHGVRADAHALAAAEPHVKRQIDVADIISTTDDRQRGWRYFDLIFERIGIPSSDATAAAVGELYEYHQALNLWECVSETVEARLCDLRRLGLRLAVVSNANGRLGVVFERLGLAKYFDCLIDSFHEGVEKPDPRLFEIALSRCGARAERTLHVGDLYHVDVVGARAAGLSAVLFDAADLYDDVDCPRVRSLEELVRMLEQGGPAIQEKPERVPYRVTDLAASYDPIRTLPVAVVLDNVRSAYNVGAFFRTADGVRAEKLYLCGFTPRPPHAKVAKTALGSETSVAWQGESEAVETVCALRSRGYEIAAIETSLQAVDLFDWRPAFPVCVVFGHEVDGLPPKILDACDARIRIPMLGSKHSLNVATAGGVVLYELLRKYRLLGARQG